MAASPFSDTICIHGTLGRQRVREKPPASNPVPMVATPAAANPFFMNNRRLSESASDRSVGSSLRSPFAGMLHVTRVAYR